MKISFLLRMVWLLILLTPTISLIPFNTSTAYALPSSDPSYVKAGVWLVNVQKFEISTGSYDVDFYLWFKWSGNPQTISYEFMNGRAASIDVVKSKEGYLEVRVRGTFLKNLSFKDYPFDKHRLTIEIEDKALPLDKLIFVPDVEESGIDPSINIAGWTIEDFKIESTRHTYPGNETFSRLVFSFTIGRSTLSSILKSIVPISFITCIAMLAFFISPSNYSQRIGLGVTTLMAAVANHLALTSQIPPIGYLTLADKVMITAYGMFLYSLIVSITMMRLVDQKKIELASKLNKEFGLGVPFVASAILTALIFLA